MLSAQIIDRAWAQIVTEHPELDTSPADEARAAAEIDLKRSCPPAVWLRTPRPVRLPEYKNKHDKARITYSEGDESLRVDNEEGISSRRGKGEAGGISEPEERIGNNGSNGQESTRVPDSGRVTALQWDDRGEVRPGCRKA